MTSYRDPSFQDRAGRAAEAKQKALDLLRAKPAADPAVLADRRAARVTREAAEAERRAGKEAARAQAKTDKRDRHAKSQAETRAAPTDAERKAARDARYAARKSRR